MSSEATPGYPAPLTACIVTAITVSSVKARCNGASASTRPIAEQLGLVTTYPPDWPRHDCLSINRMWSPLTSGITRGTSACMRKALELETTAQPAAANCGSSSRAMPASSAAKMIFGAPSGLAGETVIFATGAGMEVFKRQRAASAYARPSDRSDAASHDTSNHGCCSSIWINLCPTMPVAPRIPTESFVDMMKSNLIPASFLAGMLRRMRRWIHARGQPLISDDSVSNHETRYAPRCLFDL